MILAGLGVGQIRIPYLLFVFRMGLQGMALRGMAWAPQQQYGALVFAGGMAQERREEKTSDGKNITPSISGSELA
jgi:hypothetical protein